MLKNLKQNLKETFSDECKRQYVGEQIQLMVVAIFWVSLFVAMAVYSAKHPAPKEPSHSMPRASEKW